METYINPDIPREEREIVDLIVHINYAISRLPGKFHNYSDSMDDNEPPDLDGEDSIDYIKPPYDKFPPLNKYNNCFSDQYRNKIKAIAKKVLKIEADYALSFIKTELNLETTEFEYNAQCLYSAIFASFLFKKMDMVLHRPCEFPGCENIFEVIASNRKKKYCCDACRNKAAQSRFNAKKAIQKEKSLQMSE